MTNPIRAFIGILSTAGLVLLTGAASAQEPARQRPQQIPPTGAQESVQLTPDQLEGMRTLEAITNRSTEGLTFEHRADGTIGLDLQGRFQNVLMAAPPSKDGHLDISCYTGSHPNTSTAKAILPWTPVKGEKLQGPQVQRFAAPIRIGPAKVAAPEGK